MVRMVFTLPPPLINESYILEYNGTRNPTKILAIIYLIKQESPSAVFLQETKLEEVEITKVAGKF